VLENNCFEDLK